MVTGRRRLNAAEVLWQIFEDSDLSNNSKVENDDEVNEIEQILDDAVLLDEIPMQQYLQNCDVHCDTESGCGMIDSKSYGRRWWSYL